MTKLEELIRELCPKGVQYKTLKEILTIKNGSDYKHLGAGNVPVYGSGGIMTYVDCYVYDKPSVLIPRKGSVDKLYFVEEPFWNVDTIFYTDIDISQAMPKYVYYCLQMEHLEQYNAAGGVPSLTQAVLNKVKIPVPPLPVQREIVRILDRFTELTAGLTAELTKELTARKKQYEYYQDNLLLYESAPVYKLSNCCISIADGDHQPPPKTDSGVPFITISNITERKQIDFSNTMFVPQDYYSNLAIKRKAQIDDILYTVVGTFGTPVYIDKDYKFVFQRHIAILRPNKEIIKPKYLYYAMRSSAFYKQAINEAKGAAQKTISLSALNKMTISVPPIVEQERIVTILDRFDAVCNDITSGLSAEIEARQKQYEYYRDKLLAFQEV